MRWGGLLLAAVIAAGCLAGSPSPVASSPASTPAVVTTPAEATTPEPTPPASNVTMRTLDRGAHSGIHAGFRDALRSPQEWAAFWARHQNDSSPPAPLPAVDFPREMVVAIVAADKRSTGYDLTILDVVEGTSVAVKFEQRGPSPGSPVGAALTQPFHVVAVPMSDAPVAFVEASH